MIEKIIGLFVVIAAFVFNTIFLWIYVGKTIKLITDERKKMKEKNSFAFRSMEADRNLFFRSSKLACVEIVLVVIVAIACIIANWIPNGVLQSKLLIAYVVLIELVSFLFRYWFNRIVMDKSRMPERRNFFYFKGVETFFIPFFALVNCIIGLILFETMLISILCTVFTAMICIFHIVYFPRTYFKALKELRIGTIDEPMALAKDRYVACERKIWKLFIVATVSTLICAGIMWLDGLACKSYLYRLVWVYLFVWAIVFYAVFLYNKNTLLKNKIEVEQNSFRRYQDGPLMEGWLSGCFLFPFFLLLYQILVLLFG